VVVLDVRSGAVLAAASAPRFDLNAMSGADPSRAAAVLSDPGHPLFDRVSRMAIPPGSVFKTVAAAALLESGTIDSKTVFACRGYLKEPDRWRCAIYRHSGVGHGQVTLADALAQSCNVFFFHYADRLPPGFLASWADRFGFGRPTGIDLPGEAGGRVPGAAAGRPENHAPKVADAKLVAIGQGEFQATPLQVVRMMAAVANGGILVTPHVVNHIGPVSIKGTVPFLGIADDAFPTPLPQPIPGLSAATLKTIREGLQRVVSDAKGTAHATVATPSVRIAGKTGTAETGPGRREHAWFAGYVPADRPKVALVVVLEHAGNAAETACPVAKRLILRMQDLGYFGRK
jgi:penicillin-binding protein 2